MAGKKTAKSRFFLTALILLACSPFSHMALALKPSHEADRLMIAAEEAFKVNNPKLAGQYLDDALRLGIALPPEYNFLYGKLLAQQKKNIEARQYLESYVNREGDSGQFYREALSLITDIQKQPQAAAKSQAVTIANRGKSELRRADGSESSYVDNLQDLYGTGNTAAALITHLNNLLKFYAYGDERIIASSRSGTPSRHKIQFSSRGEIISFNKVGTADAPYTEDRFSVFGVNPHVSYQCRAATSSCWLYHPVTSQRWLQIVNNEEVALEISKAMSQLIRNLQKST